MPTSSKNPTVLDLPTRPPEACKILVVDDDERIVDVFSTILAQDGYRILSAPDGTSALEIVRQEHPDVVLMDVILPDLSGIEICRRIRTTPEMGFLPIILVTGMTARSQQVEGLDAGADDFIKKPVNPLELTARVRSLLRTKQLYDEVEAHRRELEQRVAERTQELQSAYERLKELDQVKGNILAIVSHELGTPLLQVKSALKLIPQDGINEQRKDELLRRADEAFAQLEYRIDDIEKFSDPSDLKLAPTSVTDLVTGAVEQVRDLRSRESTPVEIDLPKGLPPVMVDPHVMVRALAHLIDNGVKFGGGKRVHVSAARREDGVRVVVRDEGPGLSDQVREHLFTPLQPGDISSTRQQGGLGIGLALVKVILDAHEVELDIQSAVGKGTTVSLLLPFANL
jgi:two-component system sensor histidine kinase/response regulator